jgi:hypothetical protein
LNTLAALIAVGAAGRGRSVVSGLFMYPLAQNTSQLRTICN